MKKMKNLLSAFVVLLFAAVLLTGCKMALGELTVDDNSETGTRTLTLNVTNYETYSSSRRSASRSIFPTNWTDTDLKFYLYGVASDGTLINKQDITLNDDGTATLEIAPKNWDLTLAGFKNETDAPATTAGITNAAYLIARAHVDLSRWATTAKFTLSTDTLTTPGDVSFNVKLPESITPSDWTITAGLYNLTTGALVRNADDTVDAIKTLAFTDQTAPFALTGITSGYYTFMLELSKTVGDQNIVYHWSDFIQVLPGAGVYSDLVITDNFIGVAPVKPAAASVTYTGPAANGRYPVTVAWTDSSNTEDFFEIQLADITSSVTAADSTVTSVFADDAAWNAVTPDARILFSGRNDVANGKVDLLGGAAAGYYVSGSVLMNNTSAVLSLETGKVYTVRVRAANTNGFESAWTYTTVSGFDAANTYINTFTFTYNKNGGTTTTGGSASIVETYHYAGDTATVTALYDAAANDLKKAGCTFSSWKQVNPATGAKTTYTLPAGGYKGYADVVLYAEYKSNAEWEIFNPSDRDFTSSAITIAWDGNAVTAAEGTSEYTVAHVYTGSNVINAEKNVLSVSVSESESDWDYEYVWMKFGDIETEKVVPTAGTGTVQMYLGDVSGRFNAVVCASTRNGTVKVSKSITIIIEN